MGWLAASVGFLAIAVCVRPSAEQEERARRAYPFALACVFGMFAAGLVSAASYKYRSDISIWLLACGLVSLHSFRRGIPSLREFRTRLLPVVMLGFLFVSVKTIRDSPAPHIDVFLGQQAAAEGLVRLQNPYTASIPDIYGPGSPYYVPLTRDGRSLYGLNYPPLIALLNLPSFLLTGDVRYGHVLALILACGLIAGMQSSWLALCSAVLLLMNPFSQRLIENAWVESFVIPAFCLTLYCVSRYPRVVPYVFGLFLCTKQTNFSIFPLLWMLADAGTGWKGAVSFAGKSLGVVLAVNLPFYLWNPGAFILSLFTVQLAVPMRADLISFAAYAASKKWFVLPMWFSFLYLPIGLYLGSSRTPRSAAGFALASAFTMIPFFALSKQGAPNYYFFGLAMLFCSLALTDVNRISQIGSLARSRREYVAVTS